MTAHAVGPVSTNAWPRGVLLQRRERLIAADGSEVSTDAFEDRANARLSLDDPAVVVRVAVALDPTDAERVPEAHEDFGRVPDRPVLARRGTDAVGLDAVAAPGLPADAERAIPIQEPGGPGAVEREIASRGGIGRGDHPDVTERPAGLRALGLAEMRPEAAKRLRGFILPARQAYILFDGRGVTRPRPPTAAWERSRTAGAVPVPACPTLRRRRGARRPPGSSLAMVLPSPSKKPAAQATSVARIPPWCRGSTVATMGPLPITRARSARDARALALLHRRIRGCTRCVAAGLLPAAAPVVAGSIADRIAIVGQAPGAIEVGTRVPFSGRAGAELRRWLLRAGLGPDELPYRTAVTKCFPGRVPGGAGDRRPSPAEVALCAPWLEAELALLTPEIVVLLGTLAIERLWGREPLAAVVGRSRRSAALGGALLIPLPHPSGASRWLNDPANRARLDRGLTVLGRAIRALPALDGAGRVRERR